MKLVKRKEPEVFRKPREIVAIEADPVDLERIVDEVIAKNTAEILAAKSGIRASLQKLIIEVMRRSDGRADPNKIRQIIVRKL
jgi:aspartyl-tRNA(Asn)/glutamyl-tRNA(Gln) amidotransferase subunit B